MPSTRSLEHIFDRGFHHLRAEGRIIDFAIADYAVVGREFHKQKIPPAECRRRIAGDDDFEIGDFHLGSFGTASGE